ncbi:MAG: VOC family protein [Alphaproteobacteria bacterium]|jgi:catechol 2,3-dioxygenase-like lactoylglutathione lyase family enzyme|nr:VOC family protein [Alphaproteobacteria bacterium]MDP6563694.1 VOC family protein [Alphaproteobacteria bacterium]MDP6814548.1 VOC family protein [Alphaproteobacteria bacterium]
MSGLRHVGIAVGDMDRSLRFYRDVFGFEVTWDRIEQGAALDTQLGQPDTRVRTVKLRNGRENPLVELLEFSRPAPEPAAESNLTRIGLTHLALTVDDVEAVFDRIVEAGCRAVAPPEPSADGQAKLFFCTDPDGVYLEVVEMTGRTP